MRSVAPGVVAIKGYRSGRYLCMERNGRLLGSLSYNDGDCSFEELPGTYNVYWSEKYGAAVSLSTRRIRGHVRGRTLPPLSQFLPIRNTPPPRLDSDDESWQIPKPIPVIHVNSNDPLDFAYEESHVSTLRPPKT